MAPPAATLPELVAVQLEMVESDSDAVEEERCKAAPALTPPPSRRCTLVSCRWPPLMMRKMRERCCASRTAPGVWLVSVTLMPTRRSSLPPRW